MPRPEPPAGPPRTPPDDRAPRRAGPGPGDAARATVDELVVVARSLGDDVVVAVQPSGTSLRRDAEFARVEVRSGARVRLALHLPGAPRTERLHPAPPPASHVVEVAGADDVDDELVGWLRAAYDRAGP